MPLFANMVVSVLLGALSAWGVYSFAPQSLFELNHAGNQPQFGTTITTILGSDTLSASRTTINNNFTSLNTNKFELSDWYATTSAPQIATLGTITTGTWSGSTIAVAKGGTASTTPTSVLCGSGAGTYLSTGWGVSGQSLVSNGANTCATWQSVSFDTSANYTNTGNWRWSAAASSTLFAALDAVYVGRTATTTIRGETTATSTFAGGITTAAVGFGDGTSLSTAPKLTVLYKLTGARPSTNATGAQTSLKTATISAGTLGINDTIRVTAVYNNSGVNAPFTPNLRFGSGAATTTIAGSSANNGETILFTLSWQNASNASRGEEITEGDVTDLLGTPIGAPTALTYDVGSNIYVNPSCIVVNSSDACILSDLIIERLTP